MAIRNQFPVYRKYVGNQSYFRIESAEKFTELKIWGSRFSLLTLEARIYPDRMLIADMLACTDEKWIEIEECEFDAALKKCHIEKINSGNNLL